MDIRERHFGRIATQDTDPDHVVVDVGALIRRLVLFEQCTIESIALKEIPALISVFGSDGFLKLVDSEVVRIVCDVMTAGQVGQTTTLKSTAARGGTLPLGAYRIVGVGIPQEGPGRRDYVHKALQEVHKAAISFKVRIPLFRYTWSGVFVQFRERGYRRPHGGRRSGVAIP